MYVNIAKGIAICAVVLLHLHFFNKSTLCSLIRLLLGNSWHVAVFFLIGGFYIKNEKLIAPKQFLKKKFTKLYTMLLYYYIPATIFHNLLISIGWYSTEIDYHGKTMHYFSVFDTVNRIVQSMFFAGREPILGAMWFVYVMLLAFIGYSIISYVIHRCCKNCLNYEYVRTLVIMTMCMVSCYMTEKLGIMIPRCSNTVTAIWLIHVGYLLKNIAQLKFDNPYVAVVSFVILLHSITNIGGISLNANLYRDVIMLTISTSAALYLICYLSKKMTESLAGLFLAKCGKESFHIMALHLVGFKIGIEVLNMLGADIVIASQMPELGHRIDYIIILFFSGVLFPMVFIAVFRKIKSFVIRIL